MIVFTLPTHLSLPILTDISITQNTQVGVNANFHVKVVYTEKRASSHYYTITIVTYIGRIGGKLLTDYPCNQQYCVFQVNLSCDTYDTSMVGMLAFYED